jgi:hypothetical protein
MKISSTSHRLLGATVLVASVALGAACTDPTKVDTIPVPPDELEDCPASMEWLPNTPPLTMFMPAPHPTTECPFYRGVWQTFLIALQPDATGRPALMSYPTIDSVFTRVNNPHGSQWSELGDIKQAGARHIAVDQNGNTLCYGIHVNQAFADFIHANGLETAKAIQDYHTAKPDLFFPPGVAEFKSAWQIVEDTDPTAMDPTFITIDTTVPTISQDPVTHVITEDRTKPIAVKARLLAIHVVFTYPGHPEFVWGSLEHTNVNVAMGESDIKAADGHRDVAPIIPEDANPPDNDPTNSHDTTVISDKDFILYKAGTDAAHGNVAIDESLLKLDATKQKFLNSDGTPQQTSIYRMFPGSKSNETTPDGAITSLNHNVEALFSMSTLPSNDKRGQYRLLGAQWMDKPGFYEVDTPIQNDATNPYAQAVGTGVPVSLGSSSDVPNKAVGLDAFTQAIIADGSDSPYSILAGEDRMSSTAMESFTQPPGDFNNCFTCHNTQAITANGIPLDRNRTNSIKLLDPGLLNVSHVLSQFVLEECAEGPNANLVDNGDSTKTAVCP